MNCMQSQIHNYQIESDKKGCVCGQLGWPAAKIKIVDAMTPSVLLYIVRYKIYTIYFNFDRRGKMCEYQVLVRMIYR